MNVNSGVVMQAGPPIGYPGTARGWVFYDGVCPVCLGIIARLGGLFRRRGFQFVPLQESWVAPVLGVTPEELRREMKLRRRDGVIIGGAAAWRELGASVIWMRPLVMVAGWPGFRSLADGVYRWVARNRYCLAGVCPAPEQGGRTPHHRSANSLELP